MILDDFRAHRARESAQCAEECHIKLVFLPPYSSDLNPIDLNPIEFIWKSIRRVISRTFIKDLDYMKQLILENLLDYASHLGFAERWVEKFPDEKNKLKILVRDYE